MVRLYIYGQIDCYYITSWDGDGDREIGYKSGWGLHGRGVIVICVSLGIVFLRTHIPRDACFPARISLIIHIL